MMQDYFKAKKGKTYCLPISGTSVSNSDPLTLQSHMQIRSFLCFHWKAGGEKKKVPSLPLDLALKYLEDLKNAPNIHKIMQCWS